MFITESSSGCITHDGYVQLGAHGHSIQRHLELNPSIDWVVVHWMPDPFSKRYKRVSFQKTAACNEGSPKTDNAGDSRPRDFPDQPQKP